MVNPTVQLESATSLQTPLRPWNRVTLWPLAPPVIFCHRTWVTDYDVNMSKLMQFVSRNILYGLKLVVFSTDVWPFRISANIPEAQI